MRHSAGKGSAFWQKLSYRTGSARSWLSVVQAVLGCAFHLTRLPRSKTVPEAHLQQNGKRQAKSFSLQGGSASIRGGAAQAEPW